MKLASFDIFDTTLIRKCGKPQNIFYLLAHKLYPDDCARREAFLAWRRGAEHKISATINGRETTIADIYSENGVRQFEEYTIPQLIEAEKAVESEQLIANPAIKNTINEYRDKGYTICFISDMYLDSALLKNILLREGCIRENETVYVSCEEGARKSSGELYKKLRSQLNPDAWEHFGDHPVSDVKRAIEAKINAHHVSTPYTITESKLCNRGDYALSALAGLQRVARIHFGNDAYSALAADFVAPAYIPYVCFLLEQAKAEGIKKLYFLSRDSYILQKIAEQWQGDTPGIELKYLFVSRKALLLPYLTDATAEKFLKIQDKETIIGKKIEDILKTLGTDSEELEKEFGIGFAFKKTSTKEEEKEVLEKLFGNESAFKPHLNRTAQEKRTALNNYFAQEGLFSNEKSAMVDVGWLGTTRLMINSILREEGYNDSTFFYYGVRGDVLPQEFGKFHTYFTPAELSTELTSIIENYYSASPYPSCIGYKTVDGKTVPSFNAGEEFCHNKITATNTSIVEWLANETAKQHLALSTVLKEWGQHAATEIKTLKNKDINITPLAEASKFDDNDFVRELSFTEIARIALLGERYTACDKASMRLTLKGGAFSFVWACHRLSGRIRRYLYLKFISK